MQETIAPRVPGGYVLVRAGQLLSLLEALRINEVGPLDVRVWLACHELLARRSGAQKGTPVRYTREEVRALVRTSPQRGVDASLERLRAAGFVLWDASEVTFPDPAPCSAWGLSARRLVPVPRRTLRFLAGGTSRSIIAMMLGTLLRCAFYRRGVCSWRGTCKASWVASLFGVDERSVKRARAQLQRLGWLSTEAAPQWRLNRFGGVFTVNPGWTNVQTSQRPVSPPPRAKTRRMSPPESNQEPLRAFKHQEPAARGPTGDWKDTSPATVANIQPVDLCRRRRLLALHADACRRGLAASGEAGLLRFAALAARARRTSTESPCRLFAWMLRGQRWDLVTLGDEDRARGWLTRTTTHAVRRSDLVCVLPQAVGAVAALVLREQARGVHAA